MPKEFLIAVGFLIGGAVFITGAIALAEYIRPNTFPLEQGW